MTNGLDAIDDRREPMSILRVFTASVGLELVGLGALAGCASEDAGGTVLDTDQLAARLARALCAGTQACCDAAGFGFDRADCVDAALSNAYPAPDPSGVRYDPKAASECVSMVEALATDCGQTRPDEWPCGKVLEPLRSEGATCQSEHECKAPKGAAALCYGRREDDPSLQDTCHVQKSPQRGQKGDECFNSCGGRFGEFCYVDTLDAHKACYGGDGLYCDSEYGDVDEPGICRKLLEAGETCRYNAACLSTYCSPDGRCETTKKDGEACGGDYECTSDRCYQPDSEDPRGTCQPQGLIPSADSCGPRESWPVWGLVYPGELRQ
jgi:hypothetical protein